MDLACSVPRRTGGKFAALEQHHVFPAEFREVVEDRTAHDAAADDHHAGVGFQGVVAHERSPGV